MSGRLRSMDDVPRTVARYVALLASVLLLSSCALWDWMFKTENPATKPVELTPIKDSLNVQTSWRVSIGSGRGVYLQPAVLENAVYVASGDGALARIAPENGSVVWRSEVGAKIGAGVGSDGLTVAIVTVSPSEPTPAPIFAPTSLRQTTEPFSGAMRASAPSPDAT